MLIKDRLPAYITWDQYLKNRERIEQNRNGPGSAGVPRDGAALLPGVLVCGNCGRHMQASYHANGMAQYACNRQYVEATEPRCYGLAAREIDDLVAQQVLRALEPAAIDLSLRARGDIERERERLEKHWRQRRQRARYDVELAERRYQAVDPGEPPGGGDAGEAVGGGPGPGAATPGGIRPLRARDAGPTDRRGTGTHRGAGCATSPPCGTRRARRMLDRKQMIRCLVERVVVQVRCDSEFVDVTIHWAGGYESRHEIVRPVATYAQLRDFERLMDRVVELRQAGHTAPEIAEALNAEGFYPPKRRGEFTTPVVHQLLKRRGLIGNERSHDELLGQHEWWLTDLARELQMSHLKLRDWAVRGWVHGRQTPVQGYWILWADKDEVRRLRKLLAESRRGVNAYASELRTPKERPMRE